MDVKAIAALIDREAARALKQREGEEEAGRTDAKRAAVLEEKDLAIRERDTLDLRKARVTAQLEAERSELAAVLDGLDDALAGLESAGAAAGRDAGARAGELRGRRAAAAARLASVEDKVGSGRVLAAEEEWALRELEDRIDGLEAEAEYIAAARAEAMRDETCGFVGSSYLGSSGGGEPGKKNKGGGDSRGGSGSGSGKGVDSFFRNKVAEMGSSEARAALTVCVDKVVSLQLHERDGQARVCELEMQLSDAQSAIEEMESGLRMKEMEYDRRVTDLQREHSSKEAYLLKLSNLSAAAAAGAVAAADADAVAAAAAAPDWLGSADLAPAGQLEAAAATATQQQQPRGGTDAASQQQQQQQQTPVVGEQQQSAQPTPALVSLEEDSRLQIEFRDRQVAALSKDARDAKQQSKELKRRVKALLAEREEMEEAAAKMEDRVESSSRAAQSLQEQVHRLSTDQRRGARGVGPSARGSSGFESAREGPGAEGARGMFSPGGSEGGPGGVERLMQIRLDEGSELTMGGGDVPSMGSPTTHVRGGGGRTPQRARTHAHDRRPDSSGSGGWRAETGAGAASDKSATINSLVYHQSGGGAGAGGLPATPGAGTGIAAVRVSRSQVRAVSAAEVEAARLSAAGVMSSSGHGGRDGGGGGGVHRVGSPDGSKLTSPIASYSGLGFSSY